MPRFVPYALALSCATATPLLGQGFFVAAGPTLPQGDYGSYAQTGWMAMAGLNLGLGLPVKIRVEGLYGSNNHDGTASEKTNVYGGMASAVLSLGAGPLAPYLVGGVGYLDHHYDPGSSGNTGGDDWKVAFGGGAGLNFSLGPLKAFAEGRYLTRDGTNFVPLMVGVRLGG